MKKTKSKKKRLNARTSKILHDTMVTLGSLKEGSNLIEMPLNEIQVHLLDKDGDGVILCLEYDEQTGELNKTFHTMDEYYDDSTVEVELEESTTEEPLDSCISPENIKEFLQTRIEETISEEYDEIFHNSSKKPPLLLN